MSKILKPTISQVIKAKMVRQKHHFHLNLRRKFKPRDGSLLFDFVGDNPHWLYLDKKTGVLAGNAPAVKNRQQFLVAVRAYNDYGEVIQRFVINVANDDFLDSLHRCLASLTMRRQLGVGLGSDLSVHEILEYLFEFLLASEAWDEIYKLIKEEADEHNIELTEEVDYEKFAEVVREMNPNIDRELLQALGRDHFLNQVELNTEELRNLYRQGSQPLGAHAIAVWNYLGAPNPAVWSQIQNTLDKSAQDIVELRLENKEAKVEKYIANKEMAQEKKQQQQQPKGPSTPTPRPR